MKFLFLQVTKGIDLRRDGRASPGYHSWTFRAPRSTASTPPGAAWLLCVTCETSTWDTRRGTRKYRREAGMVSIMVDSGPAEDTAYVLHTGNALDAYGHWPVPA